MPTSKKLLAIVGVFLLVLLGAVLALFYGEPRAKNLNPFFGTSIEKVSAIEIESVELIRLEQEKGTWKMVKPVEDTASEAAIKQLWNNVSSCEVGAVVSEKKENWSTYGLNGEPSQLRVFGGGDAPKLHLYFGTPAYGYDTAYVRLAGKDAVHIEKGLADYLIQQPAEEFRERALFPVDWDSASEIMVADVGSPFTLVRSSVTWIRQDGKPVDPTALSQFLDRLKSMRAQTFAPEDFQRAESSTARFSVTLKTADGLRKATVYGPPTTLPTLVDRVYHPVEIEGRKAVLLVAPGFVNPLGDAIAALEAGTPMPSSGPK